MPFHTDLNESTRLAYLQALGVRSWYARDALPGALPSPELTAEQLGLEEETIPASEPDTPQAVQSSVPVPNTANSVEAPVSTEVDAVERHRLVEKKESTEAHMMATPPEHLHEPAISSNEVSSSVAQHQAPVEKTVTTTSDQTKVRAKPIRFACQLLLIPEQCFVVASLPQADAPGFSASQHQLMQDILFALGLSQGRPQESLFSWPLVQTGHLPQGADVAKKALQALIRSKKLPDSALVILMGREAVELATHTAETSYDHFIETGRVDSGEPCICLPSLEEMLSEPALKRLAWKQLQQALSNRA